MIKTKNKTKNEKFLTHVNYTLIKQNNEVMDPGLAACGSIFRGSMRKFIRAFSTFLDVQTALVAEFYEVIFALEEAQKLGLTNAWLECDSALICVVFTARTNVPWMLHIDGILVLITMEKSGLGLLIFFVKGMRDKLANL